MQQDMYSVALCYRDRMGISSLFLVGILSSITALAFFWIADKRRSAIRSDRANKADEAEDARQLRITRSALERALAIRGAARSLPGHGEVERWDIWAPQIRAEANYAAAIVAYTHAHKNVRGAMSPEEFGLRAVQWWHGLSADAPPHESLNSDWRRAQDLPAVGSGPS